VVAGGAAARHHPVIPLLSPQSGESRGQGDETAKFRLSHRLALSVGF